VEKGKHVFMEKPHAVDAVGARKVIEAAKLAEAKKLAVCSGFTYRYDDHKRETVKRIHDKAIGDVSAIHTTFLTGELWDRASKTNDPKHMETQLRMWYYYTWLSGDFIVEQAIHSVDKAAWVMNGELPVLAYGTGGRIARTDPKYGNIWDNFSIVYEYQSGAKVFLQCRQINGCMGDNSDHIMGTKGSARMTIGSHSIKTASGVWKPEGKHDFGFAYQQEHIELFASIRAGKPMNDAIVSAYSTLMGIMGREAAYTGQKITWEKMLASKQDLSPKVYDWVENPVPPVAIPGKTKFV
jgi:myo-inositol 2-dehydrogenase / D-chiro-inositol 1-dehydrogenase